ncbi:sn-glycerol-3-phosphate transporter [Aliidiomarina iranensis]|uniref:sn-glycerol-3-phosphate transporter n=1 Tax=Aliidiomarina iranensis TaxID=1434071 RepID=A0A432W0V3_9GAMM|nr:sn-glycerol-3-phosphate transporter [Aliidiomarina iranensis]RUO22645.1 sn-glycerol-3-phosphate transporter [Aliidiomarina iranensis]
MRVIKQLISILIFTATNLSAAFAAPSEDFDYQIHVSLWTTHFNPKPEHNNDQNLIGFEFYGDRLPPSRYQRYRGISDYARPLAGVAWFRNSFGQKSLYAYGGVRQNFVRYGEVQTYGKLTAGLIHGYRGEYKDKIPFNQLGIAPAVLPMLGAQYQNSFAELTLFGVSGVMLTVGLNF